MLCFFFSFFLEEGQRKHYGKENLRADRLKFFKVKNGYNWKKSHPLIGIVFFKTWTKRWKGENLILT